MSHWPYIIAAYGLTIGGMAVLTLVSWTRMRSAESQASAFSRSHAASETGPRHSASLGTSDGGAAKQS